MPRHCAFYVRQRTDPRDGRSYRLRTVEADTARRAPKTRKEIAMKNQNAIAIVALTLGMLLASGCAVTRGQQTVGAYIDDAGITTSIKARFADSKLVDTTSIGVETLNGTVLLSGFAKNATEKTTAESIARDIKGVKSVKNEITVQP
jgi:osmotically-inducible protein OsmY